MTPEITKNALFESVAIMVAAYAGRKPGDDPKQIFSANTEFVLDVVQTKFEMLKEKNAGPDEIRALEYILKAHELYHLRQHSRAVNCMYIGLGRVVKLLSANSKVPKDKIDMYDMARKFFNNVHEEYDLALPTGSKVTKSATENMLKLTRMSLLPEVRGSQTRKVNNQGTIKTKIEELFPQFGLKFEGNVRISADVLNKFKGENESLVKQYRGLLNDYNKVWKHELENYVRNSGNLTVPFLEFYEYIQSRGIDHGLIPGFVGNIGADALWYTTEGETINGVPSKHTFSHVEMNTPENMQEGNAYVFKAVKRSDAEFPHPILYYSKEFKNASVSKKFEKVKSFDWNVVRAKWMKHLITPKYDMTSPSVICASLCELLWRSLHRVGTTRGGNDKGTGFGMSSILLKHVTFPTHGGFKIHYQGKKDGDQQYEMKPNEADHGEHPAPMIVSERLCELMRYACGHDKSSSQDVWLLPSGNKMQYFGAAVITKYLRRIGVPEGIGAHKIRTYTGTKIFREEMLKFFEETKSLPMEYSDRKEPNDGKRALNHMGEVVGKSLSHFRTLAGGGTVSVGSTALDNYIDVEAQIEFLNHYNVRIPTKLAKYMNKQMASVILTDKVVKLRQEAHALRTTAAGLITADAEKKAAEKEAKADELEKKADDIDTKSTEEVQDDSEIDVENDNSPSTQAKENDVQSVDLDTRLLVDGLLEGGIYEMTHY